MNRGAPVPALDIIGPKLDYGVEQLDRKWALRRQELLVRSKDGSKDLPSLIGGVIGGVVAVVFGIAWIVITSSSGAPAFVPLIGLVVIGGGIFSAVAEMTKADQYTREERTYRARREAMLRGKYEETC